jgi:hypothetical protein
VQTSTRLGSRAQICRRLTRLSVVLSLVKFDPSRFEGLTSGLDPDGKVAMYAIAVSAAVMIDRRILLATRIDMTKLIRQPGKSSGFFEENTWYNIPS